VDSRIYDDDRHAQFITFSCYKRRKLLETEKKLEEKLDYMHLNPVRRGLVTRAVDWKWSSARWYLLRKPVGIPIRMPHL
jgi:REP element-mobilizing transposase RayT